MEDGKSGSAGGGKRRNEVLFASKLTLACHSLVSFGDALDPILNLTTVLGWCRATTMIKSTAL
jgi:hypothetical protein